MPSKPAHLWRYFRAGGLDQVRVETSEDLRHLAELDPKHWVALSCPVKGLEFDRRTLELIDADGDGRIRVPEILEAVSLVCACLREPADIGRGLAELPLAALDESGERGKAAREAVRRLLAEVGRPGAAAVSLADVEDLRGLLARHGVLGDGVVPGKAADDEAARRVIEDILATMGPQAAGGAKGVDAAKLDKFFAALSEYSDWWRACEVPAGSAVMPLGPATAEAFAACEAVRAKIEDYFTRCRLSEFDARASSFLNRSEADYAALSARDLSAETEAVAALPLAQAGPRRALPLGAGLNPAWQDRIARFRDAAVAPILGPATELTEDGWRKMEARLAPHAEWRRARKGAAVEPLGLQRVREILASDARDRITRLIRRDEALAAQAAELVLVERLVRYHRDLGVLLRNFVNFANFYDPETPAIFDAGRLYLDQRTCHLCIRVENPAAHAASAGMSRMYLAYCDCARPGGEKMTVAAAFTQGDSEQLTVGRNGIFFDRAGRDWDAAVTKVIENPISIHQAFFLPYKRLSRFVSEQIEKFGAAKDKEVHEAATAGLSGAVAGPDPGRAARKEPFDIAKFAGIFAAIGLAIGAIGGALGAMMAAFFSLRWWQMPFALAGVAAVVSGPAMVMAWVKLRQRTLGPVLEGNGWAINGRVRINIPLGNSLTELRQVPIRVRLTLKDPFVDRAARRRRLLTAALIVVLAAAALFYWRAEAKAAFKRAIDALQQAPAPAAAPETPKPAETPKPPAPPA